MPKKISFFSTVANKNDKLNPNLNPNPNPNPKPDPEELSSKQFSERFNFKYTLSYIPLAKEEQIVFRNGKKIFARGFLSKILPKLQRQQLFLEKYDEKSICSLGIQNMDMVGLVKQQGNLGYGVCAMRFIPQGTLMHYAGETKIISHKPGVNQSFIYGSNVASFIVTEHATYLVINQKEFPKEVSMEEGEKLSLIIDGENFGNITRFIQHAPELSNIEQEQIFGDQANNIATANMRASSCLIYNHDHILSSAGVTLTASRGINEGEMLCWSYTQSGSPIDEYIYFHRMIGDFPTIFNKDGELNSVATTQYKNYLNTKVIEFLKQLIYSVLKKQIEIPLTEEQIAQLQNELIKNYEEELKGSLVDYKGEEVFIKAKIFTLLIPKMMLLGEEIEKEKELLFTSPVITSRLSGNSEFPAPLASSATYSVDNKCDEIDSFCYQSKELSPHPRP